MISLKKALVDEIGMEDTDKDKKNEKSFLPSTRSVGRYQKKRVLSKYTFSVEKLGCYDQKYGYYHNYVTEMQ